MIPSSVTNELRSLVTTYLLLSQATGCQHSRPFLHSCGPQSGHLLLRYPTTSSVPILAPSYPQGPPPTPRLQTPAPLIPKAGGGFPSPGMHTAKDNPSLSTCKGSVPSSAPTPAGLGRLPNPETGPLGPSPGKPTHPSRLTLPQLASQTRERGKRIKRNPGPSIPWSANYKGALLAVGG